MPMTTRRGRRRPALLALLVAWATLAGAPAGAGTDDVAPRAAAHDGEHHAGTGAVPRGGTDAATGDAAGAARAAGPSAPPTYVAPVAGAVLRLFDPPVQRWGRGHRGVDLATSDGVVRSPGAGVVTFAGTVVDRGVITVTHADGLRSSLEPVDAVVPVGTQVAAGDVIAGLGAGSHCPGAACVHWGVRRGEEYLDPLGLLGSVVVVLLP